MARKDLTPFTKYDNRASIAAKKQKRGPSMKASLAKILNEKAPDKIVKKIEASLGIKLTAKQNLDIVNRILLTEACRGSVPAIREINDRIDGKALQQIEAMIESKNETTVEYRDSEKRLAQITREFNRKNARLENKVTKKAKPEKNADSKRKTP